MKQNIHPAYNVLTVTCSCGSSFKTRSTLESTNLSIEVCANCHPFYTGKQKIVDSSGRVDRFKQKYGNRSNKVSSEKSSDTSEKAA